MCADNAQAVWQAPANLFKDRKPDLSIRIVPVNIFAAAAARRDVINTSGNFNSQGPGHAASLGDGVRNCKT
jgi:hypothetical protein